MYHAKTLDVAIPSDPRCCGDPRVQPKLGFPPHTTGLRITMGSGVSAAKNFPLYLSLSTNKMDEERTTYEKLFPVWCIAVAPNGKQLASAASDTKIHLW